jgi:hypothetical protein
MFQAGAGVPKDLAKAAFWFHRVVLNEKTPGLQKKIDFQKDRRSRFGSTRE